MPLERSVLKNRAGSPMPARAGRQHLPVAEAAIAVDHNQGDVLGNRRILKAVIHQDHAGALRPCQGDARDAVPCDHHRLGPRQHQRLVADVNRRVPRRIDLDRTAQATAIATAQHDRSLAEVAQQVCQRQHRRSLAGTADMIVADADHGDPGVKPLALQTLARDQTIERAERRQQAGYPGRWPVPEVRLTHSSPPSRAVTAANTAPARPACDRARRRVPRPRARRPHPTPRPPPDRPATAPIASPALPACQLFWRLRRYRAPGRLR